MNDKINREKLLDDVIEDESLDALKESIRLNCRMELKRRRSRKTAPWFLSAAAAAIIIILLKVFFGMEGLDPSESDSYSNGQIAMNDYYVQTKPLSDDRIVRTRLSSNIIHTAKDLHLETISDEEMLSHFSGAPCALVTSKDKDKSLMFINPEDEERFMAKLDITGP